WIFHKHDAPDVEGNAPDLLKNPIVQWQNRWYKVLVIGGGFGLPTLIGALFGDAVAGLLWGGFLRLVVVHHTTFFVNSLAHYMGKPTYNAEVSARDNWAVALLTLGEGYHSFHHRFPADFRNGIRWYHWDPAKWWIRGLRAVGLAEELRTTPPPQVEQAKLRAAIRLVEPKIATSDHPVADEVRRRLAKAAEHLERAVALWRQHVEEKSSGVSKAWKRTRARSKKYVRQSRRQWKGAMRMLAQLQQQAA
ncbi:MAG TPA: fatty acid desaturase, partial [Thermoanaerobaculia bacterium]